MLRRNVRENRRGNPEKRTTLDLRHRTNTNKTKTGQNNMSNPTKTLG